MLEKIKNWIKEHKLPIMQGVCVVAICLCILWYCNGCSSFSDSDSSQLGLQNNSVTITGGVD